MKGDQEAWLEGRLSASHPPVTAPQPRALDQHTQSPIADPPRGGGTGTTFNLRAPRRTEKKGEEKESIFPDGRSLDWWVTSFDSAQ